MGILRNIGFTEIAKQIILQTIHSNLGLGLYVLYLVCQIMYILQKYHFVKHTQNNDNI